MKVTFPHMGNTFVFVKALLDDLGVDYIIPPFTSKKTLEIGTKYTPELACIPLKITIGNFVQAYEQGADTAVIVGGNGPCRFGYYGEMCSEILRDMGCKMEVITLEYTTDKGILEFASRVKKFTGTLNIIKLYKTLKEVIHISKLADNLEHLSYRVRPRELVKGSTDKVYKTFLNKILQTKGSSNIKKLLREAISELVRVETDREYSPLKVGLVGEIYTAIDPYANFNVAKKLGNMGIEVDRKVTVSGWIVEHIVKKALHLRRNLSYAEAAAPYLGTMIGGHAQETLGHTVLYAKDGYDGVIQVYPLNCMPEIVAESILPSIERDYDMPVLTLIIDEMTGEAGFETRLEAFSDLLNRRREIKAIGENRMLFGD